MKRNLSFHQDEEAQSKTPILSSLTAPVSPPRRRRIKAQEEEKPALSSLPEQAENSSEKSANLAAIEAGEAQVTDHLSVISSRLSQFIRPDGLSQTPRLTIPDWVDLYRRNQHPQGRHFLIHQHDHPIAGPHYDLRLQFSESSSVSWSIMYGMPGDPNSRRLNRNATETRVHCLWNHLIETASAKTGSMMIWDTGEYEILPYQQTQPVTDDSQSDTDASTPSVERSDSEKLREAFQNRKIRLRLHGHRLPHHYTIILRMDKTSDFSVRNNTPQKKRRRTKSSTRPARSRQSTPSSDSSSAKHETNATTSKENESVDSDNEVDNQIRTNNAYPGSVNSIGSIHQRRWFITMDRPNSGFIEEPGHGTGKKTWVPRRDPETRQNTTGFEPFYVQGPDVERSVVTGRLARDVLEDEDVQGFVPRQGWRPVMQ